MNLRIVLEIYIYITVAIGLWGLLYKLFLYVLNRLTLAREITNRTQTPYRHEEKSWLKAFWMVNVETFTRFWLRSNPVTFIGHLTYHLGLFTAVGTYAFVALFGWGKLPGDSIVDKAISLSEWFIHTEIIFNEDGLLSYKMGVWMKTIFIIALVSACFGILIPYVMTLLKKRGAIKPVDKIMAAAGINSLKGLPTQKSLMGYQRKIIGLIVLVMDWAMLSTFIFPEAMTFGLWVHVIFMFTIIALSPFTFLSHEIYRFRMWDAVKRLHEGRVA